jgi:hypothetical protein
MLSGKHGVERMIYQIEFIRRVARRDAPEVLQRANMQAPTLNLVKHQARAMFDATKLINQVAEGYQIVENGGAVAYRWHDEEHA